MRALFALRDFFFPPRCAGCHEIFKVHYGERNEMCDACKRKWELLRATVCTRCGEHYINCKCTTNELSQTGVGLLIKLVPYLQKRSVSNNTVLYIKHYRDARTLKFLAAQLAYEIERTINRLGLRREDIVICYSPRRHSAVAEEGFDQAQLLALYVCSKTGIKLENALRRVFIFSKEQKKLGANSRSENVRGAFCLTNHADVKNKTVFLVDDLVTTGATMAECARVLKKGGAALIIGVCVAFAERN